MKQEVPEMYELNKQKFGAFVSALRKERGYTQKELAQKLFILKQSASGRQE